MRRVSIFISVLCCSLLILNSCDTIKNTDLAGKTVAVEVDSLSLEAAETIKSEVNTIQEFSTLDGAVSAVESKECDFVVMSEFEAAEYIENKRKIRTVKVLPFTSEFCAYFYNNDDLLNNFNRIVLDLSQDGTIQEIKDAYKSNKAYYPNLTKLSGEVPTMTIAVDITGAPYSDLTDNGTVIGIDIDIATIVANKLGYNLEIIVAGTDENFKLLEDGEVDFVISGLMYNAERSEKFDCSFSYLLTEYYLLSRSWQFQGDLSII